MKTLFWIIVAALAAGSGFYPNYFAPIAIVVFAIYCRWVNTQVVKVAKIAYEDTQVVTKALNNCVSMVNSHSSIIKKLPYIEKEISDMDREIEQELKKRDKNINDVRRKISRR